jgi:hypothetical protein
VLFVRTPKRLRLVRIGIDYFNYETGSRDPAVVSRLLINDFH